MCENDGVSVIALLQQKNRASHDEPVARYRAARPALQLLLQNVRDQQC